MWTCVVRVWVRDRYFYTTIQLTDIKNVKKNVKKTLRGTWKKTICRASRERLHAGNAIATRLVENWWKTSKCNCQMLKAQALHTHAFY